MKARHFKMLVSGTYQGRPYKYEEQVPAGDYQRQGWQLKLIPAFKRSMIEQLNQAQVGEHFVWEQDGCRTEVWAL